jgi:hypothetical protein
MFVDYEECMWKEMIIAISGAPVTKIRGVKYKITSDDEHLHAQGDESISIQSGNRKGTGSIKLLKGAADDWQLFVKTLGARDLTDVKFTITISYLTDGTRPMMTDTLTGCKISDVEYGWEQGAKFMDMEMPFNFLKKITTP